LVKAFSALSFRAVSGSDDTAEASSLVLVFGMEVSLRILLVRSILNVFSGSAARARAVHQSTIRVLKSCWVSVVDLDAVWAFRKSGGGAF
jgi:hypothetical protein